MFKRDGHTMVLRVFPVLVSRFAWLSNQYGGDG